ncbi:MAG: TonB-dependent receptor plug domain-containing protein [Thiobacillus sp.]
MKMPAFVPRRLSLLIAVSLFPAAVSANEPTTLTTVVVEGAPEVTTPIGIDVANLPSLRSATSDTASLLRDVPGISLYGAGGISSLPTIHGLGDDRLRIKVDGMDLISACGNHMNPPLSYIDPSNVASIQVFSGIAPVSVSGDSIGGAILVKPAEPSFAAAG